MACWCIVGGSRASVFSVCERVCVRVCVVTKDLNFIGLAISVRGVVPHLSVISSLADFHQQH